MGRKKVITTETLDEPDAEAPVSEELPEEVLRALVELEGSDDIRWQIHRISQPNNGYCGTLATVELTLDRITQDYGPGRYQVKGIKPSGEYFKSARISIAAPFRSSELPDIAELMKKSGDQSLMPLLLGMMQSNSQIVTAALTRPAQQTPAKEIPWAAIIASAPATLLAVKEFFKNNSENDATEKLLKQLTVLDKLKGDDGKNSSWPDVVREALSSVPAIIGRPAAPPPAAPVHSTISQLAAPARIPDNATTQSVETPVAVEPTEEHMFQEFLRRRLDTLIEAAAKNRNPELQAELLLEEVGSLPEFFANLLINELTNNADWFEKLIQYDARIANYQGWMTELHSALVDLIQQDKQDDEQTHVAE